MAHDSQDGQVRGQAIKVEGDDKDDNDLVVHSPAQSAKRLGEEGGKRCGGRR